MWILPPHWSETLLRTALCFSTVLYTVSDLPYTLEWCRQDSINRLRVLVVAQIPRWFLPCPEQGSGPRPPGSPWLVCVLRRASACALPVPPLLALLLQGNLAGLVLIRGRSSTLLSLGFWSIGKFTLYFCFQTLRIWIPKGIYSAGEMLDSLWCTI